MAMTYDGQKLTWKGVGVWNATSGMPGYQDSRHQHLSDKGPIPEGKYKVPLKLGKNATVRSYQTASSGELAEAKLDRRSEIQSLQCIASPLSPTEVLIFDNWGSNRVRLAKVKIKHSKAAHRDGFYLHDSTKGYSHGCVEVDTDFFTALRNYASSRSGKESSVLLTVDYGATSLTTGTSTYGSTKKNSNVVVKCD